MEGENNADKCAKEKAKKGANRMNKDKEIDYHNKNML